MGPVGSGDGVGVGEYTGVSGPIVWPSNDGVLNDSTGCPCIATVMKSCQIAAGIVPPNTGQTPSTHSIGISPCGYPTHTHVASCGV